MGFRSWVDVAAFIAVTRCQTGEFPTEVSVSADDMIDIIGSLDSWVFVVGDPCANLMIRGVPVVQRSI
jgi:hypothetical protein